jgi:NitT/TauT family transport system substrate-binding protein
LATVLLLAMAACSGTSAQRPAGPTATLDLTPVTVRVGHVASTQWAPLYLALDRGYFDQVNVKVQLQPVRLGQDPVDLVARGQVDAVVTDFSASVFNGLAGGLEFKVVGSMAAMPADGTMPLAMEVARPLLSGGQVKTLADLRGRKIAIAGGAGSGTGYLADLVLRKAGIGLRDLTVVDLAAASTETAIQVGGIDVALVPAPYTTSMEQHGIASPLAAPPPGSTWSGVLYGAKLTGSPAERFFQALVRGARDLTGVARTSDDTLAILSRYTGVAADVLKTVPPYDWDPRLRPDSAALAGLQATYRDVGLLKYGTDLPASRIMDTSYARQAGR